eukprot:1145233-Pleurochrysis_carterae.AAC.5
MSWEHERAHPCERGCLLRPVEQVAGTMSSGGKLGAAKACAESQHRIRAAEQAFGTLAAASLWQRDLQLGGLMRKECFRSDVASRQRAALANCDLPKARVLMKVSSGVCGCTTAHTLECFRA